MSKNGEEESLHRDARMRIQTASALAKGPKCSNSAASLRCRGVKRSGVREVACDALVTGGVVHEDGRCRSSIASGRLTIGDMLCLLRFGGVTCAKKKIKF